jgi:hypothetical protein
MRQFRLRDRPWLLAAIFCLGGLVWDGGVCAFAKKTNQTVYIEPFDYAAGGANLTRASQEGVIFANPALMPWGKKFFRWMGMQSAVLVNKEAVDIAREIGEGLSSGDSGDERASDSNADPVDTFFSTPVHLGMMQSIGFISNDFALAAFARVEPDFEGKEFGENGLPAVQVSAEGYGGAGASVGWALTSWLSLGVTGKYLYVAEPSLEIPLTDRQRITQMTQDRSSYGEAGKGIGQDVGALFFAQGDFMDLRLALKVDDVGDTKISNHPGFRQTAHAGLGITFHGGVEALHLAVDYRDIANAYHEQQFKKIYAGARLVIRNHIGIAAGLYQGLPTYGVRLDLWLMQIGASVYGRELGDYPGEKQRNLYLAYIGFGF